MEDTPKTEQQLVDSIAYHKRVIRHLEILFTVMTLLAILLFLIIAWKNGLLFISLFAVTMFSAYRLWSIGSDWEVSKFWDELELLKLLNKDTHEKENEENV